MCYDASDPKTTSIMYTSRKAGEKWHQPQALLSWKEELCLSGRMMLTAVGGPAVSKLKAWGHHTCKYMGEPSVVCSHTASSRWGRGLHHPQPWPCSTMVDMRRCTQCRLQCCVCVMCVCALCRLVKGVCVLEGLLVACSLGHTQGQGPLHLPHNVTLF